MREGVGHPDVSPLRSAVFGEPRAQSASHERVAPEARRSVFASPQFQHESPHSFRAFRPEQQEMRTPGSGPGVLGRPSSQPIEPVGPRSVDEILARRETPSEARFATFRHFAEPPRSERPPRHDAPPFPNGVTSQPREPRDVYGSPQMDRDARYTPGRLPPSGTFGTPVREDQSGLFRPIFQHGPDAARESIEPRSLHHVRREEPRPSPPVADLPPYYRPRNGFLDRPVTFEEHQRMEAMQRDESRKGSDGGARSLLGISPELNRKGRNSPLPQAVQGAQPRFVGPGGDNPGIKMEFGRMFSGLGSGVGSATPVAGQSANGATTPSRMSPSRQIEDGDLARTAVVGVEDAKLGSTAKKRKGRRRSRDDDKTDADGRGTPDTQRSGKRAKTSSAAHHHHHHMIPHHHHHHHEAEAPNGSFNTLRFPSAGPPASSTNSNHHHHHHHATHAHPAHHHHHHHTPKAALPRKPAVTVSSQKVLDEVAEKSRKHLGSQLYTTSLSQPANADLSLDAKIKFSSNMAPITFFAGKENCTYTVRVPRTYVTNSSPEANSEPSSFEELCRHRQLWGTDVYTDDSDVVAAAVHSGWIKGDFGDSNADLHDLCDNDSETSEAEMPPSDLTTKPSKPVRVPPEHDLHVTVLILPPLETYASSMQHHIRSREWNRVHDGMSFMIHRIQFIDESPSNRFTERGLAGRKARLAQEEARRKEAAAGLLLFSAGVAWEVRVGA